MKNLDPIVEQAVLRAAELNDQPETVAKRVVSWMSELSAGQSNIDDRNEVARRLDLILSAINLDNTIYAD